MTNSVDPDEMLPSASHLCLLCCSGLSVQIYMVDMVNQISSNANKESIVNKTGLAGIILKIKPLTFTETAFPTETMSTM